MKLIIEVDLESQDHDTLSTSFSSVAFMLQQIMETYPPTLSMHKLMTRYESLAFIPMIERQNDDKGSPQRGNVNARIVLTRDDFDTKNYADTMRKEKGCKVVEVTG